MTKPFFRIVRPTGNDFYSPSEYMLDERYASDRRSLVHAYHLIENDFKKIFDYIELHDNNEAVFSHRIYELFLRTCTEFETNCTAILVANGYTKAGNLNMEDYYKINSASRLSEYEVRMNVWSPVPLIVRPFAEWGAGSYAPLSWYRSYNAAKHNRSANFRQANLGNLTRSLAGLLAILVSQFNDYTYFPFSDDFMIMGGDYRSAPNGLLSVKRPASWTSGEYYQLDWNALRQDPSPFEKFSF